MKHALAAACLYEAGAVWTGRYPTITAQVARRAWIGWLLVVAMAVHFATEAEKRHAAL